MLTNLKKILIFTITAMHVIHLFFYFLEGWRYKMNTFKINFIMHKSKEYINLVFYNS